MTTVGESLATIGSKLSPADATTLDLIVGHLVEQFRAMRPDDPRPFLEGLAAVLDQPLPEVAPEDVGGFYGPRERAALERPSSPFVEATSPEDRARSRRIESLLSELGDVSSESKLQALLNGGLEDPDRCRAFWLVLVYNPSAWPDAIH
jgi:hypothetical protein